MKLTIPQEEACQLLGSVASEIWSGDFEEDLWSLLESDVHGGLEGDEFMGHDDEECKDLPEKKEDECTKAQWCIVQNSMQCYILNLLVALFTHLPSSMDDKFYSPIHRFLVFSSLKGNGQWLSGTILPKPLLCCCFVVRR